MGEKFKKAFSVPGNQHTDGAPLIIEQGTLLKSNDSDKVLAQLVLRNITPKEIAEAKVRAEDLLAEWKSGDRTEDSFGKLAAEHTEDTGSITTGGLYESVVPDQMTEEFDAWIFDEARQSGDVEIVKTRYGYHIIYFVEHGPLQYEDNIRNILATQKYDEFFKEQTKDMSLKTFKFGTVLAY